MRSLALGAAIVLVAGLALAQGFEKDVIPTSTGELSVTFVGHGTLIFGHGGKAIHVDPFGKLADYATLPKADLVLITHSHADHLDPAAIAAIRKPDDAGRRRARLRRQGRRRRHPAERRAEDRRGDRDRRGASLQPGPMRPDGTPYHPKGRGNGYVLTFGDTRVYVAGDTENVPEMKALQDIAVAFLPMNLPYTMTPEMVADAARAFRPRILYPYHFGETDTARLVALLKDEKGIEVRVRKMK